MFVHLPLQTHTIDTAGGGAGTRAVPRASQAAPISITHQTASSMPVPLSLSFALSPHRLDTCSAFALRPPGYPVGGGEWACMWPDARTAARTPLLSHGELRAL